MTPTHTNRLSQSSSPYLLQHQHNPVDWYPWGEEALQKAKEEEKPILLSIGYSACHWCHVMEHESFEEEAVAEVMNRGFVCIKLDREERPDIDQIYMDAVQAMGIQGGWPLNVFLTPDQKPFYGGTYFPREHWVQLLQNIEKAWKENRKALEESSEKFTDTLSYSDVERFGLEQHELHITRLKLEHLFNSFAKKFDKGRGGLNPAPKFPMPSHWQFLLRYWAAAGDEPALEQALLTLREMAWGGIYDQVGGGFARYSVDAEWFVPHFEKMLYDNGQLISLYASAYTATKDELFKEVVYQTIAWAGREMLSPQGGFYSALDADSEGEEGKFYLWTIEELEEVLGKEEAELLADYYNASEEGNWEGANILFRRESSQEFARKYELDPDDLKQLLEDARQQLLEARSRRIRPGLDDKILAAWNGLMLTGLCDAYAAFGEPNFLELAQQNAAFIEKNLLQGNRLRRNHKAGTAPSPAFLDDYAFVIGGFLHLYGVSFEEHWLRLADNLTAYCLQDFWDTEEGLFFYTGKSSEALIARKKELFDNVIPSSNSQMAHNLYQLGLLLEKEEYTEKAAGMVSAMERLLLTEPQYLTHWLGLYLQIAYPTAEVAIVGPSYREKALELHQHYLPNKVVAATARESKLPLLQYRQPKEDETQLYVCYNRACQKPVEEVAEAVQQIREAVILA
ncbi:thioredoxin domain-containing protein [Cesiribacter sp. SM1]|uniref:thioredoxin domain-containing protein n=1 Tax=Cesiribacter sp. SM1 TaxID=2861196 RepID=UPI001CD237AC|nr:thioredoxin domain-containing protein [Cesiribacter sp. SM1]